MPEIEIPDYEIVREIGRGGMGVVYLARQLSLGRHVAVKVMSTASVDASNVARFLREVRLCVALSHPHVVKLLDGGTTDDWAYLAMEYLDGQDLDGWLFDHGPLRAHQLLQGMEELADALDFVHSQEIVHRDIKSANVIVAKVGGLRLMDFGLARAVESTVLTREGHAVGSPRYLAPETFTRGIMDRLTDLYSLGLVFYEMATATRPFDATTSLKDLAQRIIHGDLPPPSQHEREIPKEIDRLVLKLLSTDRAGRFQTSRELLEAIRVLRSSDSFFGTSWETSRPALNLLSDQPAVTAEPTREPRAGPPGPAEAGTRSGRHRRTTRRQPVTPQPPRRVGLGTLVAMVAAAGLLVGLILRAVVGGAPKLVQPSPEANLRLSVARRFADSASRIDLARLVKELETQHGGRATPRYSSKNLTPERLAATRQKMTAILARQSFHGPYLDLVARGGRTLLDGTLPDSLRMSIYEGLLTLSHLDHFLVHFCGLEPVYQAQAEIGAWVSLSEQIASAGEDLEAACEDVRPGGWCFPVHTNHWTRSWYLFAGLEPVHERLSYGALVPERTGYTKQEDDPRPRVTLTGNYGAAKVMAMTRYVYPLRFVRLDLKPIGETGVQPGHERSIRTLVLAPTRSPPDPESLVILGARVNRDLLPPATYEVRIRAWRLTGVEQIGCQVHGLMIQTQG